MFYSVSVQFKKLKMTVFWVVAPCSLVEVYLMMVVASIYETSVKFYQTARCNIADASHLQTRHRENLDLLI
jgi:hypothetical protein